jgi:hypothetical protein
MALPNTWFLQNPGWQSDNKARWLEHCRVKATITASSTIQKVFFMNYDFQTCVLCEQNMLLMHPGKN